MKRQLYKKRAPSSFDAGRVLREELVEPAVDPPERVARLVGHVDVLAVIVEVQALHLLDFGEGGGHLAHCFGDGRVGAGHFKLQFLEIRDRNHSSLCTVLYTIT